MCKRMLHLPCQSLALNPEAVSFSHPRKKIPYHFRVLGTVVPGTGPAAILALLFAIG